MSKWNFDDSKYSQRSTLPPVPEEEDANDGIGTSKKFPLPFFILPNFFWTWTSPNENTTDDFETTDFSQQQQGRRENIFNTIGHGGGASTSNVRNRRSWHGGDEFQFGRPVFEFDNLDDNFTQQENKDSAASSKNGDSSTFRWRNWYKYAVFILVLIILLILLLFLIWPCPKPVDDTVTFNPTSGEAYCSVKCSDTLLIERCESIFKNIGQIFQRVKVNEENAP